MPADFRVTRINLRLECCLRSSSSYHHHHHRRRRRCPDGRTVQPLHPVRVTNVAVPNQVWKLSKAIKLLMIDRNLWSRLRQTSQYEALCVLVICCITLIACTTSELISALPNQMQWTRLMVNG